MKQAEEAVQRAAADERRTAEEVAAAKAAPEAKAAADAAAAAKAGRAAAAAKEAEMAARREAELRAKEEVDAALDRLGVALMYNDRPYNRRGWCVEEDGVVRVVLAHTAAAEKRGQLSEKHKLAAAERPKLLDISELGKPREVTVSERPQQLMSDLGERLAKAEFTNDGDRPTVRRLVHDFEWLVMQSIAEAEMGAGTGAVAPQLRKALKSAWRRSPSSASERRGPAPDSAPPGAAAGLGRRVLRRLATPQSLPAPAPASADDPPVDDRAVYRV